MIEMLSILVTEKEESSYSNSKKAGRLGQIIFDIEEPIGKSLFSKAELEYVYTQQAELITEITQYLNSWVEVVFKKIKANDKI